MRSRKTGGKSFLRETREEGRWSLSLIRALQYNPDATTASHAILLFLFGPQVAVAEAAPAPDAAAAAKAEEDAAKAEAEAAFAAFAATTAPPPPPVPAPAPASAPAAPPPAVPPSAPAPEPVAGSVAKPDDPVSLVVVGALLRKSWVLPACTDFFSCPW